MILVNMEDIQSLLDHYKHKEAIALAEDTLDTKSFEYLYTMSIACYWIRDYERGYRCCSMLNSLIDIDDRTRKWAKETMQTYADKLPRSLIFYSGNLLEASLTSPVDSNPNAKIYIRDIDSVSENVKMELSVGNMGIMEKEIKRLSLFITSGDLWLCISTISQSIVGKIASTREHGIITYYNSPTFCRTDDNDVFPLTCLDAAPHKMFASKVGTILCVFSIPDDAHHSDKYSDTYSRNHRNNFRMFVNIPTDLVVDWEIAGSGLIDIAWDDMPDDMPLTVSVCPRLYTDIRIPIYYRGSIHMLRAKKVGANIYDTSSTSNANIWNISLMSPKVELKSGGSLCLGGRDIIIKIMHHGAAFAHLTVNRHMDVIMKAQDYTLSNPNHEYSEGNSDLVLFEKAEHMDAILEYSKVNIAEIISKASYMNQAVVHHKVGDIPVLIISCKYRGLPSDQLRRLIELARDENILSTLSSPE